LRPEQENSHSFVTHSFRALSLANALAEMIETLCRE